MDYSNAKIESCMPSWLAYDFERAEPHMIKYGEKIAEYFGVDPLEIHAASPWEQYISSPKTGEQWIEMMCAVVMPSILKVDFDWMIFDIGRKTIWFVEYEYKENPNKTVIYYSCRVLS